MSTSISLSEWEVMRVVWAKKQVTSKEIIAILQGKFAWSVSTIKTLLGRLVDKGILLTQKQGRSYLYQSAVAEKEVYQSELSSVLERICQRQHFDLFLSQLQNLSMTDQQLLELEKLIDFKRLEVVIQVPCNCVKGQCACRECCHD